MLRGRHRRSRCKSFILEFETLDAADVVALDDVAVFELRAFYRKSQQACSLRLLSFSEVPSERDDVKAADGTHT
jgi:hypothetical protein